MEVVIVTWQAGGGAQMAIALGRLLAARGDRVRIVAPQSDADHVAAAGCLHRSFPAELELDSTLRRIEEQRPVLERIFFGRGLPDAVAAEIAGEPCDVIVMDYLLRTMAGAAERLPAADVLLIHTIFGFHGGADQDATTRQRAFEPVNAARRELGLDALPSNIEAVTPALVRRSSGAIVSLPREFDDWPDPPQHVVHAGQIAEPAHDGGWESPWSADDHRPLVVVSLGSQYMNQQPVLQRIVGALGGLAVRALVLTGRDLPAEEIQSAANVEVRRYVPHAAVLPAASLVITHGGTGTLLAAFSAGIPVVCVPLGRDQPQNARRVQELGLGRVADRGASVSQLRAAIQHVLESAHYRRHARTMRSALNAYEDGARAVKLLDDLARQ